MLGANHLTSGMPQPYKRGALTSGVPQPYK